MAARRTPRLARRPRGRRWTLLLLLPAPARRARLPGAHRPGRRHDPAARAARAHALVQRARRPRRDPHRDRRRRRPDRPGVRPAARHRGHRPTPRCPRRSSRPCRTCRSTATTSPGRRCRATTCTRPRGFFVFGVGRAVQPSEFVEPVPHVRGERAALAAAARRRASCSAARCSARRCCAGRRAARRRACDACAGLAWLRLAGRAAHLGGAAAQPDHPERPDPARACWTAATGRAGPGGRRDWLLLAASALLGAPRGRPPGAAARAPRRRGAPHRDRHRGARSRRGAAGRDPARRDRRPHPGGHDLGGWRAVPRSSLVASALGRGRRPVRDAAGRACVPSPLPAAACVSVVVVTGVYLSSKRRRSRSTP